MKILCLQHVDFETPGAISDWAKERECELDCFDAATLQVYPALSSFDLLLVMGGPMGTYEVAKYPWLTGELEFIAQAIAAEKYVLGICLGAQLIAAALGSKVFPGSQKEIGWYPIRLTSEGRCSGLFEQLEQSFCPLHWHGDTFDLPAECVLLATSEAYQNQAFVFRQKVVGLQFHLEVRPQDAAKMVEHCAADLVEGAFVQSGEQILSATRRFTKSNVVLDSFLDRWLNIQQYSNQAKSGNF